MKRMRSRCTSITRACSARASAASPSPFATRRTSPTVGADRADDDEQHLTRPQRQAFETPHDEARERARDGQRLARRGVRAGLDQRPRDLERKERIAGRRLANAPQRRPREHVTEVGPDDVVQPTEGERTEPKPFDAPRERAVERERIGRLFVLDAHRGSDADTVVADPAEREGERLGGRAIEPLLVVDRQHHRRRRGEHAQGRQHGRRDRARARGACPAGSRA